MFLVNSNQLGWIFPTFFLFILTWISPSVSSCPPGEVEFIQECIPDNQTSIGINVTLDQKFSCGGTEELLFYFPPGGSGRYRGHILVQGEFVGGISFDVYSSTGTIFGKEIVTDCITTDEPIYPSADLEGVLFNFTTRVFNLSTDPYELIFIRSQILPLTFCGDGSVEDFELCDPEDNSTICTRDCQCRNFTGLVPYQGKCVHHCGNLQTDFEEECDGGNRCQDCQCLPEYFPDSGKCLDPQKDPIASNQSLFLSNKNLTGANIEIRGDLSVNNATIDSNTNLKFHCLNGTLVYRSPVLRTFSIQYNCSRKPNITYQGLGCYQAKSNITQTSSGSKMTLFFSNQHLSWKDRLRRCQKVSRGCQCDQASRKLHGAIAGGVIGLLLVITLVIIHVVPTLRNKIYPWRKNPRDKSPNSPKDTNGEE